MLIRFTSPIARGTFSPSAPLRVILPAMTGKKPITPAERRARMQAMFDKEYAILAEDYEFFTGIRYSDMIPDAPKRRSKAPRTSEKQTSQPSPKLN
jgi:hypothetical protein